MPQNLLCSHLRNAISLLGWNIYPEKRLKYFVPLVSDYFLQSGKIHKFAASKF